MTALFCLYLVLLILRPQEFVPMVQGLPLMMACMLICLALWAVRPDKRATSAPFVLISLMLVFMPLTVGLNGWWGGTLPALGELVPVFAICLLASMAARELSVLRLYMWTILVCACLLVYHSAIQLQTGVGPLTGITPYQGRPYYEGIFNDPNDLGQLFVLALTFVLYLLRNSSHASSRLLLVGSLAWLFYGMVLTNSRGALLATLVVLGLEGWRRYGKIAVSIAAVLGLPTLFALTRLSQLNAEEQSANDRIQAWYEGIQLLRAHPLTGVGYGRFTDYNALTAHNFIILPMAELGFIGFALWVGLIWYSVRMLWWVAYGPHARHEADVEALADPAWRAEVLAARGLLLSFIGFVISAFFLSQSYKAPLFLVCGLALARFASASNILPDPPRFRLLPDLPRLALLTLTCAVGMYVIVLVNL
jgi:putative inorganic carbon (HCO3(-)) transporter